MASINQQLIQNGFAVIPSLLSTKGCTELKSAIKQKLNKLISSHNCSEEIYFSTLNRWPLASLIDTDRQKQLIQSLAVEVADITGLNLEAFEVDVLYKSPDANLPTPCHQDVAYVFNKPYVVSTWLALADVSMIESPLQFLPGSHEGEVLPAVDFWRPDFVDEVRQSITWQQQAVAMPVTTGDALIFSAKIWHASLSYQSTDERFALVIRWGDNNQHRPDIPQPKQVEFGMWNCGEYTQKLLAKGLREIFAIESSSYIEIVKLWQYQLKNNMVSFLDGPAKAYAALEKLRVLNEAYQAYGAGDGQGVVYAEVWRELLCQLKAYLESC